MKQSPARSSRKAALRKAHEKRLAQALRENLKRRKQDQQEPITGANQIDLDSASLSTEVPSSKSSGHGDQTAD
jgi:hypothetical protein